MSSAPPSSPAYTDAQRREAADWFIVIRGENTPPTESIQAWLRWMDQHEGNRAAFDAVARAWHGTSAVSALAMPTAAELAADDYDGDESVEDWLRRQSSNEALAPVAAIPKSRWRSSKRAWLAAAGVVLAVAVSLTTIRYFNGHRSHTDEFTTKTGEQMELTLADGSHVWLGPKSRLLVKFERDRRGIQLTTGEAFFAVKKDRSRPFTVRSADTDIVAVGTAFNVRAIDQHVTVAVSEGVVAVTPQTELEVRAPESVRVASGQQLTFTAKEPATASAIVQTPNVGERARWREGVLVYRDEPLQEVVDDIVRYSNMQIEIADAAVGDLHYSGVIYHDAVQEWITALPESFPVTVISDGSHKIIKAR